MSDAWSHLRDFTSARLALGRTGNSLPTSRVLEFQLAHARAQDAVHRPFLPCEIADAIGTPSIAIATRAADRQTYLLDPDSGRTLSDAARARLQPGRFDAVLVIADGLSATAVHAHGAALARLIFARLPQLNWSPTVIVTNGRVAIGDEIAEALGAQIAVVMIGERPGLTAADSLGLYITYAPRPGVTKDSARNCISNIRPDGLPLADAVHRLAWLIGECRRLHLSGITIKEDATTASAMNVTLR
jgi:ethanolamine ammonia-lyase small subunit